MVQLALHMKRIRRLAEKLHRSEAEVVLVAEERRAERAGRTKAERELRELQLRLGQLASTGGAPPGLVGGPEDPQQQAGEGEAQQPRPRVDFLQLAFPLRPIGILQSCFGRRNGTPRQPLLVSAARARLRLRPDLSPEFFDGLRQYSHVWVLFIFHHNTDLQRLWQQSGADGAAGLRAKIRVPRLDGERMGVFATRSPHRPCPIGLSVAKVVAVEGRILVLGGADIVDGSPVLDIKPYVPFCDAVPGAAAPPWVAAHAENDPLDIAGELAIYTEVCVEVPPAVDAVLESCWRQRRGASLYKQFRGLVEEALSRDVRSVTQRIKVPRREQQGITGLSLQPGAVASAAAARQHGAATNGVQEQEQEGTYHIVLDGIDVSYEVSAAGVVQLCSARVVA
eukprot:scaffold22.g6114.t1